MRILVRDSLGRIKKGNNLKHGLSESAIYDCWVAMKARCLKTNHPMYKHYGGRGIRVCDRWVNSFLNFLEDMGEKPSKLSTLDRINNDGNYEPSNCRWVSIQEQQKNKRNSNVVVGVSYEASRKRWHASITRNGKKHFLGRYKSLEDAKNARLEAENKY